MRRYQKREEFRRKHLGFRFYKNRAPSFPYWKLKQYGTS